MKKIFTLFALMLTCVSGAFAGVFENSKIVGSGTDQKLVTIDTYSTTSPSPFATDGTVANAARVAFSLPALFYIDGGGIFYGVYANGQLIQDPSAGEKYITYVTANAKYIALYEAIDEASQKLPDLDKANHGAIGSKISAANNASGDIKSDFNEINNNNPYTKLEEAINTADEVLYNTNSSDKVYQDATDALKAATKSYAAMFDSIEVLRDSLILLRSEYQTTTIQETGKKLSEYPAAEAIFNAGDSAAFADLKNAEDLSIIRTDVQLVYNTLQNLKKNAASYSAEDLEFIDNVQNAQPAESKNGYPVIENISSVEYALYVKVPTQQMVDAGTKLAEEISKATGTAPLINYTSIAIASAKFAASMTFAGQLMAANIKHMQTLQECIDFLNTQCQYDEAYYLLSEEVERSKMNLRTADNSAVAELQHGILTDALQHATDLNAWDLSRKDLAAKIYEAEDLYDNEIANKRADNTTKVQARQNLIKYIREAKEVAEANRQYTVKRVDYTYPAAGEYSLYTFEWVKGVHNYNNGLDEKPGEILIRETTKMQNAINYCLKQYALENTLDDAIALRDSTGLFKSPKDSVATVVTDAEAFNNGITLRQYTIAQIDSVVNAIIGTLDLARDRQQIITDSLDYIQDVIDESVNNIPTDSLKDALLQTTTELMNNESDWEDVKDLLKELYEGSVQEQINDEPQNYSAYMIKKVEDWLAENDRYKELTPAQLSVIYKALSAAKTALAEWYDPRYQTYDELKRQYLLKRMYYSSLALEYVMKMTVQSPVSPDIASQQLAEALAVYACYAASQYDETIDEQAVIEGNRIFKEGTTSQKTTITARLRALSDAIAIANNNNNNNNSDNNNNNDIDNDNDNDNDNTATGINSTNAKTQIQNGKIIENGRVVIIKNGKKFTATGAAL